MPVGNFQAKKYYSIAKNGKVKFKNSNGDYEYPDYIEGYLIDIQLDENEFEGNPIPKIKFEFTDNRGEIVEVLQSGRHTLFVRDILNCLYSIEGEIGWVRFTPYTSEFNGRELVHGAVRHIGDKVKKQLGKDDYPPVKSVKVGKKEVVDTSERDEFFEALIPKIVDKLKYRSADDLGGVKMASSHDSPDLVEDNEPEPVEESNDLF
ncbi:MAG: hypothetical protein ACOCWM_01020 [Cyclobacteriaceae bacterium]